MQRTCNYSDYITTGSTSVIRNHLAFKHLQLYEKMFEDETNVKKSKAKLMNIFSNIRAVKIGLNGCCSFCPVKQKIKHCHC